MSGEEREILLAAQKEAIQVLTEANAEAERVACEAEAEAVALVLEQQENAKGLLHQEDATERLHSAQEHGALLKSHQAAAELLVATEREVAAKHSAIEANAAVEVLMAGHRQAAAILLDAWMRVTEGRPVDGERSH